MKSQTNKKKKIQKKWNQMLKHQQQISQQQKKFIPGQLKFCPIQNCQSRLVNFFGNVHSQVFNLKVSPNDKFVGASCSNGQVRIYDIYQGNLLLTGNTSHKTSYPCTGFQWKPKNQQQFITCNCDGTVRWFKMGEEISIGSYQSEKHGYLCCEYQSNEEWAACGTDKGEIEIFDNQKMKLLHTYNPQSEITVKNDSNRIFSIKCLKQDPNIFFSGGWDSNIQIYDIRHPKVSIRRFYGPLISSDSLDYHNGQILAANYRNTDILQLYDFKSGQLIQTLNIVQPQHCGSYGFGAVFGHKSQKNLIGVALSGANKVKVLRDKKVVTEIEFQAAPLTIDFYRYQNKDFLIAAGIEGTIYVVRLQWKEEHK